MNIKPMAAPAASQSTGESKAQQMRANAIKAFQGVQPASPQAEQPIVQNQNQVSAEELSAIRAPTSGQSSIGEVDDTTEVSKPDADKKVETPEETSLSRQFAQLAKQERQLRVKVQQQEQAIKAREEALKAKEQEYTLKDQEYAKKYIQRDFLKNNPLQALAEAEVSYDDLTQQILNSQTQQDPRLLATISKLEAKIQDLEKSSNEMRETKTQEQTIQRQAAVKQIEADTKKLVDTDSTYEMIKATNSYKDVVALIEQTFDEDGVLLSVEEAANEIEEYLLDEAVKLSRLGKVSKKTLAAVSPSTTPSQAPAATSAQPKAQTAPQPMKTLTNAIASTRPLSARERALLAFEGKLK